MIKINNYLEDLNSDDVFKISEIARKLVETGGCENITAVIKKEIESKGRSTGNSLLFLKKRDVSCFCDYINSYNFSEYSSLSRIIWIIGNLKICEMELFLEKVFELPSVDVKVSCINSLCKIQSENVGNIVSECILLNDNTLIKSIAYSLRFLESQRALELLSLIRMSENPEIKQMCDKSLFELSKNGIIF